MRTHLFCNKAAVAILLAVLAVASSAADPDDKAKLEASMKATKPGEMHKKLEPLAGKWEITTKMYINPTIPPVVFKATAETKWVMDGRFLRTQLTSDFAGTKFESVGLTGYDNLRSTYVGAWIDNSNTGISTRVGRMDEDGKVFTDEWEELNLITKEKTKAREVTRIVGNDTYEQTLYHDQLKVVENIAKRVK